MQDKHLIETLAPYGRVIAVQQLTIKGFPSVRSGTRRVSMVVSKAIPCTINIGGFLVTFNYRGQPTKCFVCQEVGHASKDCPKSRQGRKQAQQQQSNLPKVTEKQKTQNITSKSNNKINNHWNFFWSGKRDLVARTTVSLPKGQGGFGVINRREKADSFALQWLKRFFA